MQHGASCRSVLCLGLLPKHIVVWIYSSPAWDSGWGSGLKFEGEILAYWNWLDNTVPIWKAKTMLNNRNDKTWSAYRGIRRCKSSSCSCCLTFCRMTFIQEITNIQLDTLSVTKLCHGQEDKINAQGLGETWQFFQTSPLACPLLSGV